MHEAGEVMRELACEAGETTHEAGKVNHEISPSSHKNNKHVRSPKNAVKFRDVAAKGPKNGAKYFATLRRDKIFQLGW